jgi:hypothetical protein
MKFLLLLMCVTAGAMAQTQPQTTLKLYNGNQTIELDSITDIRQSFFNTRDIRVVSDNQGNPKQKFSILITVNEIDQLEYMIEGGNLMYKENFLDQFMVLNATILLVEQVAESPKVALIRIVKE